MKAGKLYLHMHVHLKATRLRINCRNFLHTPGRRCLTQNKKFAKCRWKVSTVAWKVINISRVDCCYIRRRYYLYKEKVRNSLKTRKHIANRKHSIQATRPYTTNSSNSHGLPKISNALWSKQVKNQPRRNPSSDKKSQKSSRSLNNTYS